MDGAFPRDWLVQCSLHLRSPLVLGNHHELVCLVSCVSPPVGVVMIKRAGGCVCVSLTSDDISPRVNLACYRKS